MLGWQGAGPAIAISDALNAGYPYLEVKCLGCDTRQTENSAKDPPLTWWPGER
jgi:hypothetical protein